MSLRRNSLFRPVKVLDQSLLTENRKFLQEISRRKLLRGGLTLGGLGFLTGCDVSDHSAVRRMLELASSFNDSVQAAIFNPNKLAPTYSIDQVVKPPRFNAYYEVERVKPVNLTDWKLELAGLVQDKQPWTLDRIHALPEQEEIIKHICVEGWDYIGQWSGPNLKQFLQLIGADLSAKYVAFHGNDDYMESIDMATALHPQTILATKYAGEPLADPFGAPLRLRTAVKLGFKNPKWIRAIEVSNTYQPGFWEKQGFNWFSGI